MRWTRHPASSAWAATGRMMGAETTEMVAKVADAFLQSICAGPRVVEFNLNKFCQVISVAEVA